ncbi:MAG TPA: hypothetical protein PKA41_04835 [Verrucomicrobiota bacterium]|nr:hypothetical protein [Verrucomicrobiota bacterium]
MPVGLTVSSNYSVLTVTFTNLVSSVTLSATGVPAGAGAAFTTTTNASGELTGLASSLVINPSDTSPAIVFFSVTNNGTLLGGTYDVAVEATGGAAFRLPIPLIIARMWGGAAFTNSSDPNWTTSGNWQGGLVPGTTDTVVFGDAGGQAAGSGPTNVVISASTEVAALRFINAASATRAHNIEFQNGATLRVSGPDLSFSMLRDSKSVGNPMLATLSGNGSLVISNPAATIGVLVDNQQQTTWDMRNLDRFEADVVRIGLGDYRVYPNYNTNGYTSLGTGVDGKPGRFIPIVYFAKTNIIKCSLVDASNYMDDGVRDYALTIANNEVGTTTAVRLSLGIYNEFFLDSICWTGLRNGGTSTYNFNTTNSYAKFRGIGGGRMSVWAQGDASGTAPFNGNVRGRNVDFSNGTVDALVDRLYLTRSSTNTSGATLQGVLQIGGNSPGSIFDVNSAYIGQQDVHNIFGGTIEDRAFGNVFGNLIVNSNATFKVNENLYLAYTTASAPGLPDQADDVQGRININGSGVVMANSIAASPFSSSEIVMTTGGRLIVSNTVGSAEQPITILNMNASSLTLHVTDAGVTNVFVNTLTTAGANVINIASIPTFPVYPTNITLISFTAGSGNFVKGSAPAGVNMGVQNLANSVILTVDTSTPQELTWTGNASPNWNFSDLNWKTSGGIDTNFNNGDFVRFDDSAPGFTAINITTDVAPGQSVEVAGMVVSNITKTYTFNAAGGSVQGSTLLKQGSGNAQLNATFNSSIEVEAGALTSSVSVGSVTVSSGGTFISSGTINGALSSAGVAVNEGTATLGPLSALSGGVITNSGTLGSAGTPGSMSVANGGTLVNAASGVININTATTLPGGSTLLNFGTISLRGTVPSPGLTINGNFAGNGLIERVTATTGNWPVNIGGFFAPGSSIGTPLFYTRLNLNSGSTNFFEVDVLGGVNDMLVADTLNFGQPNQPAYVVVNNTSGSFAPGQAFILFTNSFGEPFVPLTNNTDWNPANNTIQVLPISPGVGMRWDTRDLRTNGVLRIAAVSTVAPDIAALGPLTLINTNFTTNSETMVITTNMTTNTVFSLSWPETNLGYRLEVQTNALNVGLQTDPTNWVTWPNSWNVNQTNIPFVITNPAVFFRLVNP